MPEYSTKWQMWGGVTPETIEKAFAETPDAKAVLLVSPTYYGLCSDLQAIAEICHCHNAALLVDEAHGSHLYFSEQLPLGALESARRVSTKRRVPLHRAPSYHSVLAVSMRQEWPPICRWYRVHRRPTF